MRVAAPLISATLAAICPMGPPPTTTTSPGFIAAISTKFIAHQHLSQSARLVCQFIGHVGTATGRYAHEFSEGAILPDTDMQHTLAYIHLAPHAVVTLHAREYRLDTDTGAGL